VKDVEITVTVYPSEREPQGLCAPTTWEKIVTSLSRVTVTACQPCKGKTCRQKLGRAWAPHRIKVPRLLANVTAVTMAVFDLDDLDRDEVIDVIVNLEAEDYEYVLHSTHNHCRIEMEEVREGKKVKVFQGYESQDDLGLCSTQNRLRLVMPITREVSSKEWERLWPAAKAYLGLHPDATCKDASRLYFMPTVPVGVRSVVRRGVGKPLDVDLVLASAPRPVVMPAAAPKRVMPVFDDFDALDIADETAKSAEEEDEMSMPALRKRLVKLQRKKARSVEEKDAELYQIVKAILAGKKFAETGEFRGESDLPRGRSAAINKAASLLAFVFPLGAAWEVAVEFMQPCIADMDCEPEGLEKWLSVAEESYERALGRAFEQDRTNREMRETTQNAFAQAAELLPKSSTSSMLPFASAPTLPPASQGPTTPPPASQGPTTPPPASQGPTTPPPVPQGPTTPTTPPPASQGPTTPPPASQGPPATPTTPPPTPAEPVAVRTVGVDAPDWVKDLDDLPAPPPSKNTENPSDGSGVVLRLLQGGGWDGGGADDGTGDGWQSLLKKRADKTLKNCGFNYYLILKHHSLTKGAFRLNLVTKEIEVSRGIFQDVRQGVLVTKITHWLQSTGRVSPEGEGEVRNALRLLAEENCYNPVIEYLDSLPWDGVPRLDNLLFDYIKARTRNKSGADITEYLRCISPKMLISAVARQRNPGCQVDTMPVLEGTKEGEGKSSAVATIFGKWYAETHLAIGDKDSMMVLASSWGVGLDELSSMKKSDDDLLKSYLTRRSDRYRPPYGGDVLTVPRSCVFWGTTNEEEWLTYGKGRRRYWPIYVLSVDLDVLQRDRDQLWAEADARYKAGERWHLLDNERNAQNTEAEARVGVTYVEEQIEEWWYLQSPAKRPKFITSAILIRDALKIPPERVTRSLQMDIANAMVKRLGFKKSVLVRGTRRTYGWDATPELLGWKETKETDYVKLVPDAVASIDALNAATENT
jgi:predicted P-loop ATPase